MKRLVLKFTCILTVCVLLFGCAVKNKLTEDALSPTPVTEESLSPNPTEEESLTPAPAFNNLAEPTLSPEDKVIRVLDYNGEMFTIMDKFKELHPDFEYEIQVESKALVCLSYDSILEDIMEPGGEELQDIYPIESAFVLKYTQGEAYRHAAAYKDLGIDVDRLLKEASIAPYTIDIGTNPEGEVVALSYQSTICAFIYRRSIAKDVWGTDDPDIIKTKIGPGWEQFLSAASDLKAKGYRILSSPEDIWLAILGSSDKKWIENGQLVLAPEREKFLDLAMELKEKDYTNHTKIWEDGWYDDMKDKGEHKVFGYFGPTWFVNYLLSGNSGGDTAGEGTYGDWAICEPPANFFWGGNWLLANKDTKVKEGVAEILTWMTLDTSETGYQYLYANGMMSEGIKDGVASKTVLEKLDGRLDFLGGQNIFDVCISAFDKVNGKNRTQYDGMIDQYWLDQVREYINGNKSRERAIADFKKTATAYLEEVGKKYQ